MTPTLTMFAGPRFGLQAEPLREAHIRPQGLLCVHAQPFGRPGGH